MSSTIYRKDIDGLRAVAVLIVLAHHIWPAKVPGGYVGVDVFFVISGYLITKIIVNEATSGTFSYLNFYLRRIRNLTLFAMNRSHLKAVFPVQNA